MSRPPLQKHYSHQPYMLIKSDDLKKAVKEADRKLKPVAEEERDLRLALSHWVRLKMSIFGKVFIFKSKHKFSGVKMGSITISTQSGGKTCNPDSLLVDLPQNEPRQIQGGLMLIEIQKRMQIQIRIRLQNKISHRMNLDTKLWPRFVHTYFQHTGCCLRGRSSVCSSRSCGRP